MRQLTKLVTYLSVTLNFYNQGCWIYSFNKFDLQTQRTNYFTENFFFGLPSSGVSIGLICLSIISLIMMLTYRLDPKILRIAFIVVQFIFLIIYLWQFL
jgi:uncharacterized membrane protein YqjE